ncbi:uncharacterized protein [Castor canadensis]|uniref:Uncharacterized protein n=1 Tax=Castor canadensis TaxID=51338 RepID=A0AC58K7J1_CASCN
MKHNIIAGSTCRSLAPTEARLISYQTPPSRTQLDNCYIHHNIWLCPVRRGRRPEGTAGTVSPPPASGLQVTRAARPRGGPGGMEEETPPARAPPRAATTGSGQDPRAVHPGQSPLGTALAGHRDFGPSNVDNCSHLLELALDTMTYVKHTTLHLVDLWKWGASPRPPEKIPPGANGQLDLERGFVPLASWVEGLGCTMEPGSSTLSIGTLMDQPSSDHSHNTHCCQAQWDPPVQHLSRNN